MSTFLVVWAGQFVSLVGTRLTYFGLGIWVYVDTGSTSRLAIVLLAGVLPGTLLSPFVGALVDRWDRRRAMMVSDAGAAAGTLVILVLLLTDSLELWHLWVTVGIGSVFGAFQFPAYSAAVTLLVPPRHYGRAAGMVSLARSAATVVAPIVAGGLLVTVGLKGVIAVDLATFAFALVTLVVVRFPAPKRRAETKAAAGTLRSEARFGWRYLVARRGLLSLVVFMAIVVLCIHFANILLFPLLLSFAGEAGFGTAVSIGGIGLIAGSLLMSTWGGPERRINGVFGGLFISALGLLLMGLRPSLAIAAAGLFALLFSVPVVNGNNQVIFQKKVHPDVQGRVFAVRRMFTEAGAPVAYLLAAPLSDYVFEPLLAEDGALADSVGSIIGTGEGRGIGFFFVVLALTVVALLAFGFAYRPLRDIEDDLPDVLADDRLPDPEPAPRAERPTGVASDPAAGVAPGAGDLAAS